MTELYLSDLMKLGGIDPDGAVLIRHSIGDIAFAKCYENGSESIEQYTRLQAEHFSDGFKYWLVFIGEKGRGARFFGAYTVKGKHPATPDNMPTGFPVPEMFERNVYQYDLEANDFLSDYQGRLVIDWGNAAVAWHQKATNPKKIIAVNSQDFVGYDNLILSFGQLKDIVEKPNVYDKYISALSAVKAVYLIADRKTGKQYIGSATGSDGLFGRWKEYVKTFHGGNSGIRDYLAISSDSYKDFQFSILQIFSMNESKEKILNCEALWKNKLLTKDFGLNDN